MAMFVQTTEILLGCKIKIFDNQETKHETIDRYTVVFLDQKENKQTTLPVYACLGMNGRPYHPQGFCQHSPATLGRHLGKRISCPQCNLMRINGVVCHETACPNLRARYDTESGEWIKQRKCFICGCTVDADGSLL